MFIVFCGYLFNFQQPIQGIFSIKSDKKLAQIHAQNTLIHFNYQSDMWYTYYIKIKIEVFTPHPLQKRRKVYCMTVFWFRDLLSQFIYFQLETLKQICVNNLSSRFSHPGYWAPFVAIGEDVTLDLTHIQHAMLNQQLNEVEERQEKESTGPYLNPAIVSPLGNYFCPVPMATPAVY